MTIFQDNTAKRLQGTKPTPAYVLCFRSVRYNGIYCTADSKVVSDVHSDHNHVLNEFIELPNTNVHYVILDFKLNSGCISGKRDDATVTARAP